MSLSKILDKIITKICHKENTTKNTYNLQELFSYKATINLENKVDIIIPIYNGYDYLTNLFDGIKSNTDLNYRLIVINDKSSDLRVLPLLNNYQEIFGSKMLLVNNEENLGFVKTINKGLSLAKENVIILNSDVIVPKNWASRLLEPIIKNDKVASVTPFSNAATIFSLPQNNFDNDFNEDLEQVNNKIQNINLPAGSLKFPTGVGFCMAMNKKTIKEIGGLDEIFEKGYAEENDWCQRAIKRGYINTIAPNLFVWHKHGGSFNNKEKQDLLKSHLKILKKRYPNYSKSIKNLLKDGKYLSIRFWAELLYINAVAKTTEIWFDHICGGGTETYTFNKINELKNETLIIRIQNGWNNNFTISYYYKEYKNKIIINSLLDIEVMLKQLIPDLIVVNNLATYKNIYETLNFIKKIKSDIGTKISFRAHDLQFICPSIRMINSEHKYCYCTDTKICQNCFKQFKKLPISIDNIEEWQKNWFNFLNDIVDEIIVFSNSTKKILLTFCPNTENKISVIPHSVTPLRKVTIEKHDKINICILGKITIDKGALIIKEIDKLLPQYPKLNIKVLGNVKGSIRRHLKNVKVLGKYKVANLSNLIEKEQIDIVFIPSVWPETFSYTTAEAMSMGLPVACFDIGAPAERVKENNSGCVINNIDAKDALDTILQYFEQNL